MKTYYLDYKKSKTGKYTLHKCGCFNMPKIDHCLLMGEFNSTDNLYHFAQQQFPQWNIEKCGCCN